MSVPARAAPTAWPLRSRGHPEEREDAMIPSIEPTGRVATDAEAMDPLLEAAK
jgi:hypothetical protein